MVGGDAAHGGAGPGPPPAYRIQWVRTLPTVTGPLAGPVVDARAVVVVAERDVQAFARGDGSLLWRQDRRPARVGVPLIAGDLVVVGEGQGRRGGLVAFRVSDGAPAWRCPLPAAPLSDLVADGEAVYAGTFGGAETDAGHVVACDLATGELRWAVATAGDIEAAPAVAGGRVVAVADDPTTGRSTVHAFDAASSSSLWTRVFEDAGPTAAPAIRGETVIVTTSHRGVVALDASTGEELWTAEGRDVVEPLQVPAVDELVIADRTHLRRLDPATGRELWSFPLADLRALQRGGHATLLTSSPAIVRDVALVGDTAGTLSALDVASGRRVWSGGVGRGQIGPVAPAGTAIYLTLMGEPSSVVSLTHDPGGRLRNEPSPSMPSLTRALTNFLAATVPLGALALLLGAVLRRWVRSGR